MHYLIKKILPSGSWFNHFRYWPFIILLNLLPTSALATVPSGETAKLVGFMGNNQTYALVVMQMSEPFPKRFSKFIVISLSETDNNWLDELAIISESENKKIDLIWKETNIAKRQTAYYQFYLSSIESPRKSIYQQKFTPAADSKHYSAKDPNKDHTKSDANKVEFCLDGKNQATLSLVIVKQFDSSLYRDRVNASSCFDNNRQPLCSNCAKKIMQVNEEEKPYIACPPGLGKIVTIKNSESPQDFDCDCHNTGYIMAAKLSLSGKSVTGAKLMITGETHQQNLADAPPNFFCENYDNRPCNVLMYQNYQNDIIVVGSIANAPAANGTFYPLVVAYPNNLMDDEK